MKHLQSWLHTHSTILLVVIIFIACVLRIWQVVLPETTLNRDEAGLAYNAFLLQQVGKDEWGRSWPIMLESFGDYKLPGYPLLLVGLFQLGIYTDFLVRLPSVMAGSALVVISYFLAKTINHSTPWALMLATLVAFSPVLIFYSRFAYEANVALLYMASILLLLHTYNHKAPTMKTVLGVGVGLTLLSTLAVFTYNSPLIILPCTLLWWSIMQAHTPWRVRLIWITAVVLPCIIAGIALNTLVAQKSGITIFSDETTLLRKNEYRLQWSHPLLQQTIGHSSVYYAGIIGKQYLESWSPTFSLWGHNLHPWHTVPGHGLVLFVVYIGAILAAILALYTLINTAAKYIRHPTMEVWNTLSQQQINLIYLFGLASIGLLPALVTVDAPHVTRSLFFLYLLPLLTTQLWLMYQNHLHKNSVKTHTNKLHIGFLCLVIFINLFQASRFYYSLLTEYPQHQRKLFQFGLQDMLYEVTSKPATQPIAFVDPDGMQYVLVAWYLKLKPEEYFATVVRQQPNSIGFSYGQQVSIFHFIAQKKDRLPEEKQMMSWDSAKYQWILETF